MGIRVGAAAVFIVGTTLSLSAQDDTWTESRFQRVHLKNGNFIDGSLADNGGKEVVLKLKYGDMAVRRDQIDHVEVVRIRSLNEKPRRIDPPKPAAVVEPPPPPPPAPEEKIEPKFEPVVKPFLTEGNTKESMDQLLARLRRAASDRKDEILRPVLEAGSDAILHLTSMLETLDSPSLSCAAQILIEARNSKTLPFLAQLLESPSADVRAHAAIVMGEVGDADNAGGLHRLLKDKQAEVRRAAVAALRVLNNRDSLEPLAPLGADPDPDTRNGAIEALFAICRKHNLQHEAMSALKYVLDGAVAEAKADILAALGRSGLSEGWSLASPSLSDDAADVRAAAAAALGLLAVPESTDALLVRLGAESEEKVRVQLAGAAGRMKLQKAVGPLMEWLSDDNVNVQMAASRSLRDITGQNFGTNVEQWASWWNSAKPAK